MSKTVNQNNPDKPNPDTVIRGKIDESLLDIIRKERAIEASKPEVEKFIEELFFHISKCSDDTLSKGQIPLIKNEDIASENYNISDAELPQINNSIRIINRLFKISHGLKLDGDEAFSSQDIQSPIAQDLSSQNHEKLINHIKIIDIENLPAQEITRINVAVGSKNLAEYLALIVNHENSSRNLLPKFSPIKISSVNLSSISTNEPNNLQNRGVSTLVKASSNLGKSK